MRKDSDTSVYEELYPFFFWRIRQQRRWLYHLLSKMQERDRDEIGDNKLESRTKSSRAVERVSASKECV